MKIKLILVALVLSLVLLSAGAQAVQQQQVPGNQQNNQINQSLIPAKYINIQGILSKAGVPVPDKAIGFKIDNLGLSTSPAPVKTSSTGFFNANLDVSSIDFSQPNKSVQILYDNQVMNIPLSYVPYALFSDAAQKGAEGFLVDGRMRINNVKGNLDNSAGIWLTDSAQVDKAFIGMAAEDRVGLWAGEGKRWGLTMNTYDGAVGIFTTKKPADMLQVGEPGGWPVKISAYDTLMARGSKSVKISGGTIPRIDALDEQNYSNFTPLHLNPSSDVLMCQYFGKVGIGTATPTAPLTIQRDQAFINLTSTNNSYGSVLELKNNAADYKSVGAINFLDSTNSVVSQISHVSYNGLSFLDNGKRLMSLTNGTVAIPDRHAVPGYGMNPPLSVGAPTKNEFAAIFWGQVYVDGYLQKAAGSFLIDHPLDPKNKVLRHSFVESPDMKNIYDGVAKLNDKGEATVQLPKYFEALNRDFRYQLTALGEFSPVFIKSKIKDNKFVIAGGKAGQEISWQVTGSGQDAFVKKHPLVIEEEKGQGNKFTKGKYLNPDAFGENK